MTKKTGLLNENENPKKESVQISVRLPKDMYDRLEVSSAKMGLRKSAYVNHALKTVFDAEDMRELMPDMLKNLQDAVDSLNKKI